MREIFEACQRIVPTAERLVLAVGAKHPRDRNRFDFTVLTHKFDGDKAELATTLHQLVAAFEED